MSAIVDTLVQQAKGLPEQDKLALLDALFGLVSPSDPGVEQAWIAECEQRAAAIDSGAMALLDADDVMMKYRQ
ncbi:MAG: addiction module protein [Sideroxydans sp.]|nr:addiction module protein [Sideroxydans sp.]NOT99409.1 addiction module protein [Sideroxydans sp.]